MVVYYQVAYLLTGELAEYGGDVGGVRGHQFADGLLDLARDATRDGRDHLL